MNRTYLVNFEKVMSIDEIIAKYSWQANWDAIHTNIIIDSIIALTPGQMVYFSYSKFSVSGEDDDGEWNQILEHPEYVQMMDEEISTFIEERNNLNKVSEDIENQLKILNDKMTTITKSIRNNQGKFQKYANSKGFKKI